MARPIHQAGFLFGQGLLLVPKSVYQIHFLYPVPALVLADNLNLTCYLL